MDVSEDEVRHSVTREKIPEICKGKISDFISCNKNKEKTSRDFSVQNKILPQEDAGCFVFNGME